MVNQEEVVKLTQVQIEQAYKEAREDCTGALLRFMELQFLNEVRLSDAQRLTSEMLYLRFLVNSALLRDLKRDVEKGYVFFDVANKQVYVSFSKLLQKAKECNPIYMRLLDVAYDKCRQFKDVSAYPRITDKRYSVNLLDMSTDYMCVYYCVLPAWKIERLYTAGTVRLMKVKEDIGVIRDFSLLNSKLDHYVTEQAEKYLEIKRNIAGPTYTEWKKHRPACVASEYIVCGLNSDIQRLLKD